MNIKDFGQKECPTCKGSGKVRTPCPLCDDTGIVINSRQSGDPPNQTSIFFSVACPNGCSNGIMPMWQKDLENSSPQL
jgi:DnaJ-class molecular chaperone